MNLIKKWTSLSTLWKILSIAIPSVVIIGVIILIIVLNSGLSATTMRLLRIEGTVTLQDASGNDKSIVDGMRFSSGDAISTGVQSLAQIAQFPSDGRKQVFKETNDRKAGILQLSGNGCKKAHKPVQELVALGQLQVFQIAVFFHRDSSLYHS